MLKAHRQRIREEKARQRREANAKPPVVVARSSSDPRYTLVELKEPGHLRQESRVLGHCLGFMHETRRNLDGELLKATDGLSYALAVYEKHLRLFSLRYEGVPMLSLSFSVANQRINHIEGPRKFSLRAQLACHGQALLECLWEAKLPAGKFAAMTKTALKPKRRVLLIVSPNV